MHHRCPVCDKQLASKDEHYPFCSSQCRLIDLGRWIDGDYRIGTQDQEQYTGVDEPES